MRQGMPHHPENRMPGRSTARMDRHPDRGAPRRGRRARWKLLTAIVTTALLSATIAAYLLPNAPGGWTPLRAAQWLGGFAVTTSVARPIATSPSDFGVTPFPSPTPTDVSLALTSRRTAQACGRNGAPPRLNRSLIASAQAAPGAAGEVALTFDDGPDPTYTPPILDLLHAWNAPATFFVVGIHAQRYPALVHEEVADGYTIGNHTMYHLDLTKLSPADVQDAISSAASTLRAVTGSPCLWLLRPPYGHYDPTVISAATAQGFTSVVWDLDGLDWTSPGPAFIANRIIGGLHAGAIILLHDGSPDFQPADRSQTVAALPAVLAALRARGLRPVTLPTLLSDAGYITLNP
jgi:peptidoglycan/xylan/chitin deacetylase (PgdA/CDA1 family)